MRDGVLQELASFRLDYSKSPHDVLDNVIEYNFCFPEIKERAKPIFIVKGMKQKEKPIQKCIYYAE